MKPYYQDSAVTIYHGDCREIVPLLGKFDLLLTDPPYGIAYDARGGGGSSKSKSMAKRTVFEIPTVFGDDVEFDPTELFCIGERQMIWGAHCFYNSCPKNGRILIWKKRESAPGSQMDFADAELCFDSKKGLVRVLTHTHNGFIRKLGDMDTPIHPTQKPLEVMLWCISLAGDSAQTILDPFAGVGTTGRAAKDLGRKCTMIEREEKYCEISAKRMQQEVLTFEPGALSALDNQSPPSCTALIN